MDPSKEIRFNRLASEISPYLLQHSRNPVDWYPWGEDALRKAKDLDRPIFLSIGYSSCHWCHVMERESFENEDIARILNANFISIKVDREERPDLDGIYMAAVQVLTGTGGWPLSVFLTPDLRPFWGGTYFPPESRHGLPGFGDVLLHLASAYRAQRDKVEGAAAELTRYLVESAVSGPAGELPGHEAMEASVLHDEASFDEEHGGFGPAPKFPRPIEISKLLWYHHRTGKAEALRICEKTLEAMALGGLYDQIGGGFHRYSTDASWQVPHFEKMLYDNALLARTYLETFQVTGKDFYREVAIGVIEHVLREMTSPDGGFYSATDADSEEEEGKFFVWRPEEVEAVLGKADGRVICEWFNITPAGNFEGATSIPHITRSPEAVARAFQLAPSRFSEIVRSAKEGLYRTREKRTKPFRDEKILTSWNALMVSALARAAQVLEESRYLEAAEKAAALLWSGEGRLHRLHKDGVSKGEGYLDDHAFLAEALIDLYEATFRVEYLVRARKLADELLDLFWSREGEGLFFTSEHHGSLICRRKDILDNATPSGTGVAALSLLRLERLTGCGLYRERALQVLRSMKGALERYSMALGSTLMALEFCLKPPLEVAIVGDLESAAGRALLRTVRRAFVPRKVVAGAAFPVDPELSRTVPLLDGKAPLDGNVAAFVCKDCTCAAPVTDAAALEALLQRELKSK